MARVFEGNLSTMILEQGFTTNGILSDDEDNAETLLGTTAKALHIDKAKDTNLLVGVNSSGGFMTNGLLDDEPVFGSLDTTSTPYSPGGTLDDNSVAQGNGSPRLKSSKAAPAQVLHAVDESQEELPSLSQVLYEQHPHMRKSAPPPGTICATTYHGKAIHLKRRSKRKPETSKRAEYRKTASLLETPVYKMMEQLSEVAASNLYTSDSDPCSSGSTILKAIDNDLWVDRYRPSRFTDLLGDERVHRETMSWLKEWDHCVFGKRKAVNRLKTTDGTENNTYEDTYRRPREKILLLSGPAGYGKTTLAHVAARQAGYEVMEINASDARSGQVVDDRIRPALESGFAVGRSKPVCVVIDEIDGATGAGDNASTFIHKLVGLTFEKGKKKGRGDKGKEVHRPLLRPMICICNDLYASSLAKLRQHARIIRFTRPADVHLTKRLRSICEHEGLRADSRALTALVGVTKGDLRGCLNTLQFIKSRSQEVTEPVVRAATVGIKENDSSYALTLGNLFAPLPKKRVKELGLSEQEELRYVSRLSADVESSGSIDRVAMGCFEHYANLRHYDASLSRHEKAINWLATFDTLSGTMRSEREYGLLPYLPYPLVPFYPLFSERGGSKVERPKVDWENLQKTRTHEEIYKSLAKGVQLAGQHSVGLRHMLSGGIMQLELAPLMNRILSPPLRPVNSQVTKPKEKALLARLVEIMSSFDLRFVQERAEDGQLVYLLDPPIDAFITYDGKRASDVAVPRYATRQLIAAELDAKMIARQAEATERGKTKTSSMFKSVRKGGEDELASTKRKADTLDPADKPPVDFFGRPIAVAPVSKKSKVAADSEDPPPVPNAFKVSYRYREGNSAAVRKPVKVSAFL